MDIVFDVANSVWEDAIKDRVDEDNKRDEKKREEKDYNDDPDQKIPPSRYKHRRPLSTEGNSGDFQIVNVDRTHERHHRRTQNIITKVFGEQSNDNMKYYFLLGLGGLIVLKMLVHKKDE